MFFMFKSYFVEPFNMNQIFTDILCSEHSASIPKDIYVQMKNKQFLTSSYLLSNGENKASM